MSKTITLGTRTALSQLVAYFRVAGNKAHAIKIGATVIRTPIIILQRIQIKKKIPHKITAKNSNQRYIKTKNNPDTTLVIPVSTLAIEVEITSKTIFTKVFNVELALHLLQKISTF